MYVHETGVGYTLYIQNDKYAKIGQNETATEEEAKSLRDYLASVINSIPELKAAEESGTIGIGVYILPGDSSSTLKNAVDQTTQKMLDEGTDEDILKGVLGFVKDTYSRDVQYGASGVSTSKNSTVTYDLDALNDVLSKFEAIYGANMELASGLGTFKAYVNDIYRMLKNESDPTAEEIESAATAKNDLVETLIAELDESENEATTMGKELNKKLYGDYIKSLSLRITGRVFQQYT